MKMARAKSRQNTDVCADCGALDPSWASINKGIFLCIECCSIHRSLGRHISQVKSLQKSPWSNSQLNMVQILNNSGINNIWEHSLDHSKSSRRKPGPKDLLHVKAEFIRAKHQQYAFVFRPNSEDGLLCVENELGKQLHASVRSSNLETSLRLLIQGADPNYFHDEKGSTPLHVAAKANQIAQAELLVTYGADPTCPDAKGKTPIDYAKQQVNQDLAHRLIDCQYEVTDKFSNYLCHRKPDHEKGVHFLIPQAGPKSDPNAVAKLKKLPNHVFEELVMDVYDEVDRRETEAIWLSSADTMELNANAVPFLPVDPSLSTTRNQGRQKLGRFTSPELKSLVYDILVDTQRRQLTAEKASLVSKGSFSPQLRQFSQISDDEPLYDSVASDDDYAFLMPTIEQSDSSDKEQSPCKELVVSKPSSSTVTNTTTVELLTKKLYGADVTISDLKSENNNLKALVGHLSSENNALRSRLSKVENQVANRKVNGDSGPNSLDAVLLIRPEDAPKSIVNGQMGDSKIVDVELKQNRRSQRPSSMYETREGLRTINWQTLKNQIKQNETTRGATQSMYANAKGQTIMQCTEQITKGIQQLWKSIQGPGRQECLPCADRIKLAVTNLTAAVPTEHSSDVIRRLLDSAGNLQSECATLQTASKVGDTQQVDRYLQQIRLCAYEIAKDTKILVTTYTSH